MDEAAGADEILFTKPSNQSPSVDLLSQRICLDMIRKVYHLNLSQQDKSDVRREVSFLLKTEFREFQQGRNLT